MPTVGRFLELLEAVSRRDWTGVTEVVRAVAEVERQHKHFAAAHQLLEAVDVAVSNSGYDRVGTMATSASATTHAPSDALMRVELSNVSPPALTAATELAVREFIAEWQFESQLRDRGLAPRRTVLMHGPPGCGKTHLAHHIATALRMPLYVVRFDNLVSSYLGETSSNLRTVFEFFASNRCVMLIDEIDAIAKLRDDRNELGELKRVVISLLQNIDHAQGRSLLIAATNHAHLLDPALWRRFELVWEISRPGRAQREAILSGAFGSRSVPKCLDAVAEATDGLSGADLVRIVDNARRTVVLHPDVQPDEALLLGVVEHVRTRTLAGENDDALIRLALSLRSGRGTGRYSFKELERLTGVSHSTLHHRSRQAS